MSRAGRTAGATPAPGGAAKAGETAALRGGLQLAAGLAFLGVAGYVFLALAGQILGPARFGGVGALFLVIGAVATGVFVPIEQELARQAGRRSVTGESLAPVIRGVVIASALVCLLAAVVCALAAGRLAAVLGGQRSLVPAIPVGLAGYAACFVARGVFVGRGLLGRYAAQLVAEGLSRIVALAALYAGGVATATTLGWAVALSPWAGFAATARRPAAHRQRAAVRVPVPVPWRALMTSLGLLLGCATISQFVINAGPVVMQATATPAQRADAGAFLAALVVARVPIFLFAAVQPSFLPRMAAHAQAGRRRAFAALALRLTAAVGAVGVIITGGLVVAGPYAMTTLFGFSEGPDRARYLQLGIAVTLILLATVFGQSLIAQGTLGLAALGWAAGLPGAVLGAVLADDPVSRCAGAFVGGAAAAACVLGGLLLSSHRRGRLSPSSPPTA